MCLVLALPRFVCLFATTQKQLLNTLCETILLPHWCHFQIWRDWQTRVFHFKLVGKHLSHLSCELSTSGIIRGAVSSSSCIFLLFSVSPNITRMHFLWKLWCDLYVCERMLWFLFSTLTKESFELNFPWITLISGLYKVLQIFLWPL